MTKHSYFSYTSTYISTHHNINRKHNIHHNPLHKHTTLQGLKNNNIFNNGFYTTNILTDDHIVTTTDIKTNMRHIHTSIVSRHLDTRGNNKIMRTPPPHITRSEEILPRLTRRTVAHSEQINHPSSNYTYTKSMLNHIHHHYAPSVTLTSTKYIICGQTTPA